MKSEKLKRNFWLSSEIDCMLNLIKEVKATQGTTATTHYTFVQIANKMKKRGFPNKSPTQIRRKWFQMKSAYLCFKKGNVDRLMLIPEKFRNVIAKFVDNDIKMSKTFPSEHMKAVKLKSKLDSCESKMPPVMLKFIASIKHNNVEFLSELDKLQESLLQYEQRCQAMRDVNLINLIRVNLA